MREVLAALGRLDRVTSAHLEGAIDNNAHHEEGAMVEKEGANKYWNGNTDRACAGCEDGAIEHEVIATKHEEGTIEHKAGAIPCKEGTI